MHAAIYLGLHAAAGNAADLAVTVSVQAGRDQGMDRAHPTALSDLEHERIGGHERERTRVLEPSSAELLHVRVEFLGHLADLALRQK